MDLRREAEQRATAAMATTPTNRNSSRSFTGINVSELTPPHGVNETLKAAKLAEADYKWNGPRSRIPSGEFIPPRWVPDEESERCVICHSEFDLWNRRHHCRHCGQLVCQVCSPQSCLLPDEFGFRDPQRVCNNCTEKLLPMQETLSRTIANHMCSSQVDVASEGCSIRRHANLPLTPSLNHDLQNAAYTIYNLSDVQYFRDKAIPLSLLQRAKAVVVLTIAKAGFFFSAQLGTGVAIAKRFDGTWSAPCAVACVGVGYGLTVGAEMSDVVVVLTSDEAVSALATSAQITLGAELEVAVGGMGRSGGAELMVSSEGLAPAITFSHSKGFFAGFSLEGTILIPRHGVNRRFYGRELSPYQLLVAQSVPPPRAAAPLYTALTEAAAQAPGVTHSLSSPQISRHAFYTHSSPLAATQPVLPPTVSAHLSSSAPPPRSLVSEPSNDSVYSGYGSISRPASQRWSLEYFGDAVGAVLGPRPAGSDIDREHETVTNASTVKNTA